MLIWTLNGALDLQLCYPGYFYDLLPLTLVMADAATRQDENDYSNSIWIRYKLYGVIFGKGKKVDKYVEFSVHACENVKYYTNDNLEHVTIDIIFRDLSYLNYALNE
ncbi:hypothetical protein PHMEG_0008950 [Phytophthora megakarya]|uniref:Uncharacterized protein n=1 Tax=Phytophthora megakarya TaxID=4795 RepID=A0A225WI83_9STRA|nr:hypothetical protein PHMEG_0008950 [Phytophthora megakarya]